jgi:hypothetical protein
MGGSSGPRAAREQSKTQEKSTGKTETEAEVQKTLPDWLSQMLQGQAGGYAGTTGDFSGAVSAYNQQPFNADQLAGYEAQRGAFGAGTPYQTAIDELLATGRGDYLYGGPGFNAAVEAAQRQVMPQVLSRFGLGGRDGGLAATALGSALTDPFANQYTTERGRQLDAAKLLPGMGLLPGQTLQDIGASQQETQRYGLSLYPQLAALFQGSTGFADPFGGTTSSGTSKTNLAGTQFMRGQTTPAYFPEDPFAKILGGALAGASVGAKTGNPYLAAAGGVAGGVGGAF